MRIAGEPLDDGTGDTFELDIAEIYYPSLIRSNIHRNNSQHRTNRLETRNEYTTGVNLADAFHDYSVLWTPSALVFALDGNAFMTIETQGVVKGPRALTMHVPRLRVLGL